MSSQEEAEFRDLGDGLFITGAEVSKVVKKTAWSQNKINPDIFNALDVVR